MLFFIKHKPIVVDCFTSKEVIYNNLPVDYSSNFFPEWWKKLDKKVTLDDNYVEMDYPTMKSCLGFMDFYKNSVTIPLWCDYAVRVGHIGSGKLSWKFSDGITDAVVHPTFQRGDYLPDSDYIHTKIISPWKIVRFMPIKA